MKKIKLISIFLLLAIAVNLSACSMPATEETACRIWQDIVANDSLQFLRYRNESISIYNGYDHVSIEDGDITLRYNGGYAKNFDPHDISFTIEICDLTQYLNRNLTKMLFNGFILQEDAYDVQAKISEFESTARYYIKGSIYVDGISLWYLLINFNNISIATSFYDWADSNTLVLVQLLGFPDYSELNNNEITCVGINNYILSSPTGEKIEITNQIIKKIESASARLINIEKLITQI